MVAPKRAGFFLCKLVLHRTLPGDLAEDGLHLIIAGTLSPNALHGLELGLNSVPVGLDRLGVNTRDWIHEEQRVVHGEVVRQARNVANPIVGPPFVTIHHRTRLDGLLDDGQQCCSIPSLHQLHKPDGGGR